jgi:hypothetical protein
MSKWLIVLPMLFASAVAAAPAWTWIDENGRQHYSDRPVPGARQIELSGAQGFSTARRSTTGAVAAQTQSVTPAEEPFQAYQSFNILSPAHQETLWNIGGNLNVQVELRPALQPGHQLDVFLDGQRVIIGSTAPQFTVPDVFRGLHTLQAVIMDSSGREVLRSLAVTVMVQQTSIQNPNNAR